MESDLISRSALLEPFEKMRTRLKEGGNGTAAGFVLAFIRNIKMAPAVDAVEVVRCKDCIHYRPQKPYPSYSGCVKYCCRSSYVKVRDDDFCSYGERGGENAEP